MDFSVAGGYIYRMQKDAGYYFSPINICYNSSYRWVTTFIDAVNTLADRPGQKKAR